MRIIFSRYMPSQGIVQNTFLGQPRLRLNSGSFPLPLRANSYSLHVDSSSSLIYCPRCKFLCNTSVYTIHMTKSCSCFPDCLVVPSAQPSCFLALYFRQMYAMTCIRVPTHALASFRQHTHPAHPRSPDHSTNSLH